MIGASKEHYNTYFHAPAMHGAPRPTAMSASESTNAQKSDTRAVTHSLARLLFTTSSTASSSLTHEPTPTLSTQHVQPEVAPCSAAAACPLHRDAMLALRRAQHSAFRRARSCRFFAHNVGTSSTALISSQPRHDGLGEQAAGLALQWCASLSLREKKKSDDDST